jgi:hypothetical protein
MTILLNWEGEEQSTADLRRKFEGTWSLLSLDGAPPEAYYWYEVHAVSCRVKDKEGVYTSMPSDKIDIVKANLKAGVYTLGESSVAVMRRTTTRQWQQGLCSDNSVVLKNGVEHLKIYKDFAPTIFKEQVDIPMDQALASLKSGQAIRLTSRYWVEKEKRISSLYRLRARLGSWCAGKFFLAHNAEIFEEELKDELGIVCHRK